MFKVTRTEGLEHIIDDTVPDSILLEKQNRDGQVDILGPPISEGTALKYLKELAEKNQLFKNYIGGGYNPVIVPPVVLRNVLENPAWYTSYTPYQVHLYFKFRLKSLKDDLNLCLIFKH